MERWALWKVDPVERWALWRGALRRCGHCGSGHCRQVGTVERCTEEIGHCVGGHCRVGHCGKVGTVDRWALWRGVLSTYPQDPPSTMPTFTMSTSPQCSPIHSTTSPQCPLPQCPQCTPFHIVHLSTCGEVVLWIGEHCGEVDIVKVGIVEGGSCG